MVFIEAFIYIHFFTVFFHIIVSAMTYRLIILPCLKQNGYDYRPKSRRSSAYRQVLRADKCLSQYNIKNIPIKFTKLFLRNFDEKWYVLSLSAFFLTLALRF